MTTIYEVYMPATSGPERVQTGVVISRHRTPEAAQRAIDLDLRRLRRQPGMQQSWHDYWIRAVDGDGRRRLTDAESARISFWPDWARR